jgi:hypothetical protein
MSVASIDYPTFPPAPVSRERQVVDIETRLARAASMRRVYTFTEYVPRHRAEGPAA